MNTDNETLKKKLNPEQYRVMREKDTERPFSGKYWDNDEHGVYACAACDAVLFATLNQFDADNGHPSFTTPVRENDIVLRDASADGVVRAEVMCKNCDSHLGYTAEDQRKGKYYVINSASLEFTPLSEIEREEEEDKEDEEKKPTHDMPKNLSWQNILALIVMVVVGGLLGNVYGGYMCEIEAPFTVQALSVLPPTPSAPVAPVIVIPPPPSLEVISTPLATTTSSTTSSDGTPAGLPTSTSSPAGTP